jgi:hypothetical protein
MVLQLISCSPRRDQSLLVTVASVIRIIIADLTPAIGASGPHVYKYTEIEPAEINKPLCIKGF